MSNLITAMQSNWRIGRSLMRKRATCQVVRVTTSCSVYSKGWSCNSAWHTTLVMFCMRKPDLMRAVLCLKWISGLGDMDTTKTTEKRRIMAICSVRNQLGWAPIQVSLDLDFWGQERLALGGLCRSGLGDSEAQDQPNLEVRISCGKRSKFCRKCTCISDLASFWSKH